MVELEADGSGSAPRLSKIRRWFDQPAYVDAMTDNVIAAIESLPPTAEAEKDKPGPDRFHHPLDPDEPSSC